MVAWGDTAKDTADHDTANALLSEAVHEARTAGSTPELGTLLHWYGSNLWRSGRLDEALEAHHEALSLLEQFGDMQRVAAVLAGIGNILRLKKDDGQAVQYLEHAVRVAVDHGNVGIQGFALNSLGIVHYLNGRAEEALAAFQGSLDVMRRIGDIGNHLTAVNNIASLALELGRPEETKARLDEALEHMRQHLDTQDVSPIAAAHELYSMALLDEGDVDGARMHASEAVGMFQRLGAARRVILAQCVHAAALVASGDARGAARMLLAALPDLSFSPGDTSRHAFNLVILAHVALQLGQPVAATQALALATLLERQIDVYGFVGRQNRQLQAVLRERLGNERFEGAWRAASQVEQAGLLKVIEDSVSGAEAAPAEADGRILPLLPLLTLGLTNREVAGQLGLSPNTVRNRLSRLYAQYGVSGREGLLDLARERGWLEGP